MMSCTMNVLERIVDGGQGEETDIGKEQFAFMKDERHNGCNILSTSNDEKVLYVHKYIHTVLFDLI